MSFNRGFELSVEENAAFNELKNRLINNVGEEAMDDNRIYRFLRARDFDVKQAEIMLKKNLECRRKNKVDTILEEYTVSELYEKYFPFHMLGFDRDDSAVIILSLGKTDLKGLMKSKKKEETLQYITYFLESCERKMKERSKELGGKPVETWTIIMDFEGFSFIQASSKAGLELRLEACLSYDANYPERLKTAYIINTSAYFYFVFNVIKPFLSSRTMQKIRIFRKEGWKEELLKVIDPEVLPAYLGGTRTDPDGNIMCHTIMNHGGPIPERFFTKNDERRLKNQPGVKVHVLKRRSKFDMSFDVEIAGSFIEWNIETDNHDIAFGVFYKAKTDGDVTVLIPIERVETHLLCETGTLLCEKIGIYILRLDNSHSMFRQKRIYYRASVVLPHERETKDEVEKVPSEIVQ